MYLLISYFSLMAFWDKDCYTLQIYDTPTWKRLRGHCAMAYLASLCGPGPSGSATVLNTRKKKYFNHWTTYNFYLEIQFLRYSTPYIYSLLIIVNNMLITFIIGDLFHLLANFGGSFLVFLSAVSTRASGWWNFHSLGSICYKRQAVKTTSDI